MAQAWGYHLNEALGATGEAKPVITRGVARDVLWEDLSSDVQRLRGERGVPLAPDAVLVELPNAHSTSVRLRAFGVPLLGLLLGLLAASEFEREPNASPPPSD